MRVPLSERLPPPPVRIRQDLVISKVGDEFVIFDPKTNQAHSLNTPLSASFRRYQQSDFIPTTAEDIYSANLLQEKNLLENLAPKSLPTRREALALLGKVAMLPAVISTVMPEPLAAMSGVTEMDCVMGVPGSCEMICIGPITARRCGADPVSGDCGCFSGTPACPCN